ncbi:S8 family serine peptidase [Streptomyces mayteni]
MVSHANRSDTRRRWGLWAGALAAALCCQGLAAPGANADETDSSWHLGVLRSEDMWQHTQGEGITVAVLDTGVDDSIPELQGQVLDGVDLTWGEEGAHVDIEGHGTAMASLIAGTGADGGVLGLAPEATILPIRQTPGASEDGGGFDFALEERYVEAISYAIDSGAQIISISLTGLDLGFLSEELDAAFAEAARQDVLIFAGTGNAGDEGNTSTFPANHDGVVGVAAVGPDAERATYSTYGPQVAIAAPGTDIASRCELGSPEICLTNGTSNATALASASAALIWSANPDWTKNQVLRAMIGTASGGGERDEYVGYGMVQPARVIVDGEGDPGDPDVNPLFEEYEASLDPPVTPEPQPAETEVEPAPGADAEAEVEPGEPAAGEAAEDSVWPVVGAVGGGVVVVAAVLAAVVWRRRRQRLETVYGATPDGRVP